jgi:hypothetical protein
MKFSAAAVLAVAAGASAMQNVTWTTEVVTAITTYCPAATTFAHAGTTYTVTEVRLRLKCAWPDSGTSVGNDWKRRTLGKYRKIFPGISLSLIPIGRRT